MTVQITITFDGDVYGLSENRISITAFGPALSELVKAFRRTASNILAAAVGDDEDSSTGRLHRQAVALDLELEAVHRGSACPVFVATQRQVGQQNLFNDLPRMALDRLLQDIEAESAGRLQSKVARQFLAALPRGLRRQEYVLVDGGQEVRRVAFGEPRLSELPGRLPSLVRTTGSITGLGFVPGDPYVEILASRAKKPILCFATTAQVEEALRLRASLVEAMSLSGDHNRLLWLRPADTPFVEDPPDMRLRRIHADWSVTLKELAK